MRVRHHRPAEPAPRAQSSKRTLRAPALAFLHDVVAAGRSWLDHEGPRLAASLSLYSLLSLAPLVILSIAISSFAFGQSAAQDAIIDEVRKLMGPDGANTIRMIIQHGRAPKVSSIASVIGLFVLLFGASSVFGELQSGLNKVWDAPPPKGLGLLALVRSRLVSFALVLAFGFLLLISLVFSAALTAFGHLFSGQLPLPQALLVAADALLSFGGIFVLLGLILRYVPDVPLSWGDVWQGALATAVLFTVGKALFGLYLGTAAVVSAYGAAGSLIVVILWVYYSAMIFYFGASFTRVRGRSAQARIAAAKNSQ
ncbi:MAG TPA: YihY/virulence factor BrkB family protein [Steroidobacteraceae bacterium]|nr:YihY/virulence factor BrkB family protein [Steroidobacteraceae bacterium]